MATTPEFDDTTFYTGNGGTGGANVGIGLTNIARAIIYAADRLAEALEKGAGSQHYPQYPQYAPYTTPYIYSTASASFTGDESK